jgi:hemolysin activation/secretion protein
VSVDYEGVNYSNMKMKDYYGGTATFNTDNTYIKSNYLRNANILRVGAEMNLTPSMALRGGYAYYDDGRPYYEGNQFVSCGLGFRLAKGAFLDLAWQGQLKNENGFTLYNDYDGFKAPLGYVSNANNKLLATLRFKF